MHLLVTTGGSAHSTIAVQFSSELAKITASSVTVLTVIKHAHDQARAEEILAAAVSVLQTAVSPPHTKIRIGHPAEEIVREAEEGSCDLIILGEHAEHSLLTRLFGPVSQQVVDHSTRPVLIAKKTAVPIRHLLLCDSGVRTPSLLNRVKNKLPHLLAAADTVTVLHVMSQMSAMPGVPGKQLRATADELIADHTPEGELLERDVHILEQMDVQPQPLVRHGLVVDEIVAEASRGNYDLVVIGAHRHENMPSFLLDDLAQQIIRQIDRAVLIVQ